MTIHDTKPSIPVSYWCKRSVATWFLCMHPSAFEAPTEYRLWNRQPLQQPSLHCLYWKKGWSIIYLLLCAGHCISVHQPSRCCEASLPSKCDHSIVCHEVLLLLLKVFQSALSTVKQYSHPQQLHHTFWTNVCKSKSATHLQTPKLYHWSLKLHLKLCHFGINCGAVIRQASSCN